MIDVECCHQTWWASLLTFPCGALSIKCNLKIRYKTVSWGKRCQSCLLGEGLWGSTHPFASLGHDATYRNSDWSSLFYLWVIFLPPSAVVFLCVPPSFLGWCCSPASGPRDVVLINLPDCTLIKLLVNGPAPSFLSRSAPRWQHP